MKAMVLPEPGPVDCGPLRFLDLPVPEPGSGEVLIRVEVCGVCRTDLHVVEGELPPHRPGVVPGHEVVGRVERLGAGSTRFQIGDRAGVAVCLRSGLSLLPQGRGEPLRLAPLHWTRREWRLRGVHGRAGSVPLPDPRRRGVAGGGAVPPRGHHRLAAEIPLHTETQEFPLEAANEALQRLKHDQINGAAVLRVS